MLTASRKFIESIISLPITTYSPVAKLTSFCTILAITAHQDWDIESFDFNGACFNGELDANKETFMQAPLGYDDDWHTIKCLIKLLYALKQAGRCLYDTLVHALKASDSTPVSPIRGVFVACVGDEILVLLVHG